METPLTEPARSASCLGMRSSASRSPLDRKVSPRPCCRHRPGEERAPVRVGLSTSWADPLEPTRRDLVGDSVGKRRWPWPRMGCTDPATDSVVVQVHRPFSRWIAWEILVGVPKLARKILPVCLGHQGAPVCVAECITAAVVKFPRIPPGSFIRCLVASLIEIPSDKRMLPYELLLSVSQLLPSLILVLVPPLGQRRSPTPFCRTSCLLPTAFR